MLWVEAWAWFSLTTNSVVRLNQTHAVRHNRCGLWLPPTRVGATTNSVVRLNQINAVSHNICGLWLPPTRVGSTTNSGVRLNQINAVRHNICGLCVSQDDACRLTQFASKTGVGTTGLSLSSNAHHTS